MTVIKSFTLEVVSCTPTPHGWSFQKIWYQQCFSKVAGYSSLRPNP